MAERLTAKQEKFVHGLLKGKSQREAYRAAYDAEKMSDAAVDVAACNLLKNHKVALRYDTLHTKVVAKAEEQAIMSAVEVLKEIESIAKGDISEYLSFRTEKTVVGHDRETGEPIIEYAPVVDVKDSATVDTKNIQEVTLGANGSFKFKMYSRDTALYKLAELYGIDVLKKAKQKLAEERFEHDKDIAGKRYF